MNKPQIPVCPHCGSNEIIKDAVVSWDSKKQDWTLCGVYGPACNTCGKDIRHLNWKEI